MRSVRPYTVGIPTMLSEHALPILEKSLQLILDLPGHNQPWQVILVNNSGDSDLKTIRRFEPMIDVVYPFGANLGVAGSWNTIIEKMKTNRVVLLNDDVAVTEDLVIGLAYELEPAFAGGYCAFALDWDDYRFIGSFDENFFPAYYEDADYTYRMKLKGLDTVDIGLCGATHQERTSTRNLPKEEFAASLARTESNKDYYIRKWGGPPFHETFKTPFGV